MSCIKKMNAGSFVSKNLENIRLSDEESTTGDFGVGAMAHPLLFVKIYLGPEKGREKKPHKLVPSFLIR